MPLAEYLSLLCWVHAAIGKKELVSHNTIEKTKAQSFPSNIIQKNKSGFLKYVVF